MGIIRNRLPFSIYQTRYWSKWKENPKSTSFNTSVVFEVSGKLNTDALKYGCRTVTRRNAATNVTFNVDIPEQYYTDFRFEEFYCEKTIQNANEIEENIKTVLNEPFDLKSGPLCKFHLIRVDNGQTYFILRAHHIIADAIAAKNSMIDLLEGYCLFLRNQEDARTSDDSYSECIRKSRELQTGDKQERAEKYWKAFLEDTPLTVNFPVLEEPTKYDQSAESIFFDLKKSTEDSLKSYAKKNRTTLFVVLSALYGYLLSRYAKQRNVLVSYPVNTRPKGFGRVAGCFVNLSLYKVSVNAETNFKALVDQLTQQRSDAKPHQFYQLNKIVNSKAELDADIEKSCFSILFGETHLNSTPIDIAGLRLKPMDIPWNEEFDRELRMLFDASDPQKVLFRMDFQSKKFDKNLIQKFIEDFIQLADRVTVDSAPLEQIPLNRME